MQPANPKCHDVAIIGAGPAGASAALALARKGLDVVLCEKAVLPRYKTCGGGVLNRAYKLLPPSVSTVVERSFNSARLNFMGTDFNFVVTRPDPIVHLTMRADLDRLLAEEARAAGAQIVESCLVKNVTSGSDSVRITTDQGELRAKFVIAADGVHSVTAKTLGWPELPRLAPALEWELQLADQDFQQFNQMPRFDFNSIDAGYAWVFPKRAHLSVGILSTRRVSTELQTRLNEYIAQLGLTRIQNIERHGYLIPLKPRPGPLARDRILLVGDAAGLVDPITAEGISYAVQSGQLAATAVIDGQLDGAKVCQHYQALLEKQILPELRAGRFLAHLLYHHPRLRNWAFRVRGQTLSDFVANVIAGERNYQSALRSPVSYFKMFGLIKS